MLSVRYYMTLIQIFLKVFLKIQTYFIYIANSNCLFLSNEPIFQYIRFEMNKTCFISVIFQEYISSVLPRTAFYLEWSDKNIISINNTSSIFTSEPNAEERANFFNH